MRRGQVVKAIKSDSQVQLNVATSWYVQVWFRVNAGAAIAWPGRGGGICIPAPRHIEKCKSHVVPDNQQHNGAAARFLRTGNTTTRKRQHVKC